MFGVLLLWGRLLPGFCRPSCQGLSCPAPIFLALIFLSSTRIRLRSLLRVLHTTIGPQRGRTAPLGPGGVAVFGKPRAVLGSSTSLPHPMPAGRAGGDQVGLDPGRTYGQDPQAVNPPFGARPAQQHPVGWEPTLHDPAAGHPLRLTACSARRPAAAAGGWGPAGGRRLPLGAAVPGRLLQSWRAQLPGQQTSLALCLPYAGFPLSLGVAVLRRPLPKSAPRALKRAHCWRALPSGSVCRWHPGALLGPGGGEHAVLVFSVQLEWSSDRPHLAEGARSASPCARHGPIAGSSVFLGSYGAFAAATVLAACHCLRLTAGLQRADVAGLTQGAIKGFETCVRRSRRLTVSSTISRHHTQRFATALQLEGSAAASARARSRRFRSDGEPREWPGPARPQRLRQESTPCA